MVGQESSECGVEGRVVAGERGPKEGDVRKELREGVGDKRRGWIDGVAERRGREGGGLKDKRSKREQGGVGVQGSGNRPKLRCDGQPGKGSV
jgi:hypothetical protein